MNEIIFFVKISSTCFCRMYFLHLCPNTDFGFVFFINREIMKKKRTHRSSLYYDIKYEYIKYRSQTLRNI